MHRNGWPNHAGGPKRLRIPTLTSVYLRPERGRPSQRDRADRPAVGEDRLHPPLTGLIPATAGHAATKLAHRDAFYTALGPSFPALCNHNRAYTRVPTSRPPRRDPVQWWKRSIYHIKCMPRSRMRWKLSFGDLCIMQTCEVMECVITTRCPAGPAGPRPASRRRAAGTPGRFRGSAPAWRCASP